MPPKTAKPIGARHRPAITKTNEPPQRAPRSSTRPSTPPVPVIPPEWLRVPEAVRVSGICRSMLYEMIQAEAIRSMCLKKPGAYHGIRLISYRSLMDYIENFPTHPPAPVAPAPDATPAPESASSIAATAASPANEGRLP